MDSSGNPAVASDKNLGAETFGRKTICTYSGFSAGCIRTEADGIWRGGNIMHPVKSLIHGFCYFVHAHNQNDMGRAEREGGDPVSGAIDVYQLSVQSDGVAAH